MSNQYKGKAGNVTAGATKSITSSTNATPIVVLTSTAHGLTSGDTVDVAGHQTNTAANGQRTVTVVDSTHFSLDGSVGNGVGGATGTVHALAFNVAFTQPSDGDDATGSSIDVPLQAAADREAAILVSTGKYKCVEIAWAPFGPGSGGTPGSATAFSTTSLPGTVVAANVVTQSLFSSVQVGDVVEVTFLGSGYGGTNTTTYGLGLAVSNVAPGAAASWSDIQGGQLTYYQALTAKPVPISLQAYFTVTTAGTLAAALRAWALTGIVDSFSLVDFQAFKAELWRPTLLATQ